MDVGGTLRQARERKGLTLDHLSRTTRVAPSILAAIERNDASRIPPRPYGRGFVRTYAREVGLDPEPIVRDYFAQFAPPPTVAPASSATSVAGRPTDVADNHGPRPAVALVLLAVVAAAVVVAIAARGLQRQEPPETVGTGGHPAPAATSSIGHTSPPPSTSKRTERGVTIALEATAPSWVTAEADGRRQIYRLLQPGERELLRATREIRIRTGDAGALRWQVDGGMVAAMGRSGEVRTVRVTAGDTHR